MYSSFEWLEQALQPASDDWPVFPSNHAPSLYQCLPDDSDTEAGSLLDLLREHDIAPPLLSTNGARDVMKLRENINDVVGINLYGSVVRGDVDRRSDIDL